MLSNYGDDDDGDDDDDDDDDLDDDVANDLDDDEDFFIHIQSDLLSSLFIWIGFGGLDYDNDDDVVVVDGVNNAAK